jgi:murein L,D-transpeptidase YcbB/YkuD
MTLLDLRKRILLSFCLILSLLSIGTSTNALSLTFKQRVAELVVSNKKLAKFYESTGYAPLWIGTSNLHRNRRSAFFKAISSADTHGLPVLRYNPKELKKQARTARTQKDLAAIEVSMSQTFLTYAADIQTGLLIPKKISKDIQRKVPYRDHFSYLKNFAKSNPAAFLKALPPKHPEYARLLREKLRFERIVARAGWGKALDLTQLRPGDTGKQVVKLRNRLIAMGYLKRNLRRKYDAKLQAAVTAFQKDHGLNADGVAGPATLSELNTPAKRRLQSIIVAMERIRWNNKDLGERHVLVNLTDFTAKIIQNDEVTFRTRSVVGANMESRRTPEFSDIMELMVINPTWHVPRSIAVTEYLPVLQEDPLALDHLILYDDFGLPVNRAMHDFNMFDEQTFPFDVKQLPSPGNALGLVKFLFPNPYNIYLHDTPEKSLFSKDRRTFSHGCVRLQQPFEFAYNLLKTQEEWPEEFFNAQLTTGMEISVNLEEPVPVHLIYRTATVPTDGRINFRSDIYGRDELIWQALSSQGVALQTVRG